MSDLMNNENKNNNSFLGNIKKSFSGRKFRSGVYVTLVSAIVMIMVLVANLIVSKLNIQVDISSQNLYTLSSDTKKMLKDLKDDITIYYMVQPGDEQDVFKKIVDKYDAVSSKVKVVSKDPVLYPKFADKYNIDSEITENSFIVVNNSNNRAKYVDYNDMLVQQMNYQTYQNQTTGIDVEGKLSSAIQYVTTTDLPKMYVVNGHQEEETGDSFKSAMDKMNVTVKDISTMTEKSIPKDCDILYINGPKSDLSADELKMIKDYLIAGGNAILNIDYDIQKMDNFKSLLKYYGIETVDGFIVEGDGNMHLANNPHYLIPNVESHDITSNVSSKNANVVMAIASGMKISDSKRSSLKIEPLLTTSDKSYSKMDIQTKTLDKEKGDIDGPFNVGLVATDTYNSTTSHMVVYSSSMVFSDGVLSNAGNGDILTGTVNYLSGKSSALNIPTKSTQAESINIPQEQAFLWAGFTVLVLPILILAIGVVVSLRRRKR